MGRMTTATSSAIKHNGHMGGRAQARRSVEVTTSVNQPRVEFCGELTPVEASPFTVGRDANLVLDEDNRYLHRQFLALVEQQGIWLLSNVGTQLTATVSDADGRLEAFLAPGGMLPLVFARTVVRCTAGPTTYEFSVLFDEPAFRAGRIDDVSADLGSRPRGRWRVRHHSWTCQSVGRPVVDDRGPRRTRAAG